MTDLVIADHQATFALHPLEGSSRFSLLGLLAGLNGLTRPPNSDPATDEQKRIAQEFLEHSDREWVSAEKRLFREMNFVMAGVYDEAKRLGFEQDERATEVLSLERQNQGNK
jgi:hypothetical protein